jgi:regulator of sigma E protease
MAPECLARISHNDVYFALPVVRRWLWRLAGPVGVYGFSVLLGLAAIVAAGRSVDTATVEVLPNGPAGRAGMLTGDRIVAVNGVAVTAWEPLNLQRMTQGLGWLGAQCDVGDVTIRLSERCW